MTRSVTLSYRRDAPSHYVARFGAGGWCEGWGWSAEDAMADLARAIADQRPAGVPHATLSDPAAVAKWLDGLRPAALLDDR